MQKKKWILEILGNELEKHGFAFVGNEQSLYKHWHFEREADSVKQRISLLDESFTKFQTKAKALHLEFSTTAYGSRLPIHLLDFIPKELIPEAKNMAESINRKLFSPLFEPRHWVYEDVDSFKKILTDFILAIEDYGLAKLAELSIEKEVIPTNEMGQQLISSYTELSKTFIQNNQPNMMSISKENVTQWFDVIEQKMKSTKDEPYQNVQNMLVEITAFLGEQLRKAVGGKWRSGLELRFIIMYEMNVFATNSWLPLACVVGSWRHQDIQWLKERYFLFLDSKLPVSHQQMAELNKRAGELSDGKFKYPAL